MLSLNLEELSYYNGGHENTRVPHPMKLVKVYFITLPWGIIVLPHHRNRRDVEMTSYIAELRHDLLLIDLGILIYSVR